MSKYRFKSSTDVNNYNKFLLDLDSKCKNKNLTETKDVKDIKNIKEHVLEINKQHDAIGFNNFSKLDILCNSIDPNEYNTVINENDSIESRLQNYFKMANALREGKDYKQNLKPSNIEKIIIKRPNIEPIIKNHVTIDVQIDNIGDLLKLIELYPDIKETKYNINMKILHAIKEPLSDLNSMIGMKNLKENIVDQILFYIQNLHKPTLPSDSISQSSGEFMHTVIYGPPGTGKTEVAKIIGQIFAKIGILNKGTFKKVTRSDLIAGFLGQTAIKTRDVIKECLGGVLFIDEAYALGSSDKRDSFSKECIDTLCEALSDHKDNLMVIIAGYEHELNECFFNNNQGLNSRFTWRFKTDAYTADDLYNIFIKKVKNAGWEILLKDNINVKWFEKNKGSLKSYGRDIETLFAKVKIAHSRRVFCLDETIKKKITLTDLDKGLDMFLKNDADNKRSENMRQVISSMYM